MPPQLYKNSLSMKYRISSRHWSMNSYKKPTSQWMTRSFLRNSWKSHFLHLWPGVIMTSSISRFSNKYSNTSNKKKRHRIGYIRDKYLLLLLTETIIMVSFSLMKSLEDLSIWICKGHDPGLIRMCTRLPARKVSKSMHKGSITSVNFKKLERLVIINKQSMQRKRLKNIA